MKFVYDFLIIVNVVTSVYPTAVVINTWGFKQAAQTAWDELQNGNNAVSSVVKGCNTCELTYHLCDQSVGFGGSPDENGETALDAMIMDGLSHDAGAVANLRRVKSAIEVAFAVMKYTKETLLVGDLATEFALQLGFKSTPLNTSDSTSMWKKWKQSDCQPNFWQNVSPDPTRFCGPYHPSDADIPSKEYTSSNTPQQRYNEHIDTTHHDTIGMVALDQFGNMAVGTSTNGATFKIPGRVGDSPIIGAGAYVDNNIGGAAATGDGDVMMRFLPSYEVVRLMGSGMDPTTAAAKALNNIAKFYPKFSGALVALNKTGTYGAACYGFSTFQYSIGGPKPGGVKVLTMNCQH